MHPKSVMAFVVTFLALSAVADKTAMFAGLSLVSREKPSSLTGTITEWHAGEAIAVGGDHYRPDFTMALRPDTVYEGDANTIKVGTRVTVWYRNVSERRLVVEKVRVLDTVTAK